MARFDTGTFTLERETDDATIEIFVQFTVSGSYRPQRACPVSGMEPAEYPEVEIDEATDSNGQRVELTEDEIERVEDYAINGIY